MAGNAADRNGLIAKGGAGLLIANPLEPTGVFGQGHDPAGGDEGQRCSSGNEANVGTQHAGFELHIARAGGQHDQRQQE